MVLGIAGYSCIVLLCWWAWLCNSVDVINGRGPIPSHCWYSVLYQASRLMIFSCLVDSCLLHLFYPESSPHCTLLLLLLLVRHPNTQYVDTGSILLYDSQPSNAPNGPTNNPVVRSDLSAATCREHGGDRRS